MRTLIVNADDFGLNEAATLAILECHAVGAVTSTTLMANAPATTMAAASLRDAPALGVGLHFNLTWGRPLLDAEQVPSLVDDDGRFVGRGTLAKRSLSGALRGEHVRRELAAQFERLRSLGVAPTHIDSHQHVHAFPQVFTAVAAHCERAAIPMRVPWVERDAAAGIGRRIRRAALSALLSASTRRWRGRVAWNDGIGSVFDLGTTSAQIGPEAYRRVLASAAPGAFELMVHPVTSAAAMEGYTRVGEVGEAEYRWLRTGELPALAAALGFRLASYRGLRA